MIDFMANSRAVGCAQLKVTGTGSGSCGPTIKLPGAYNANDKNIYIPNFYNGFDPTTYTAPGGPVASCGGASGGSAPAKPTSAAASKPISTPTKSSAIASASASKPAVVEQKPSKSPVASATPVATASPVASAAPSTPSKGAGEEQSGALPEKFTIDSFITWLEGKATGKVRRHARAF